MKVDPSVSAIAAPAYLVALDTGFAHREYPIDAEGVVIGRDGGACSIVVTGGTVSRCHARLAGDGPGQFRLFDLDSTNGVFVNGARIIASSALHDGDLIGIGSAVNAHLRFQRHSSREPRQYTLAAQAEWIIGRDRDSDLPLPFEPTVSSRHAVLTGRAGVLHLTDNHSLNGTWVNGKAVRHCTLRATDTVVIGTTRFWLELTMDGGLQVRQRDCGQAVHLEGVGLSRTVRQGADSRTLLDNITLSIAPGEFVGILGPSGAGKTTLLTTLAGATRPDRGQVLLDETPLDSVGAMFRNAIGYVPQDDILHPELTVETSLDYVARLRLSPDLDRSRRANIVDGAIETLGLGQVRHTAIHQLSGGQRKRVSIGSELLVRPSLLFLDEPTSGLDPSTEDRLMRHFRALAHNGTTVIITTHVLYNLDLLDKVAFLAQGKLVFFGTPAEALVFFGADGQPLRRPTRIFDLLTGEGEAAGSGGTTADQEQIATLYARLYRDSLYIQEHMQGRLSSAARSVLARPIDPSGPRRSDTCFRQFWRGIGRKAWNRVQGASLAESFRSWGILSRRHLHIRSHSLQRLLLFVLIPVVLALATLSQPFRGLASDETVHARQTAIQESVAKGGMLMEMTLKHLLLPPEHQDPRSAAELLYSLRYEGVANLPVPMSVLVMMVMTAVFSGTVIACLEISTERSMYRRERMSHLRIGPYLASKLPFCMAMTGLQCLVFVAICWLHPILPLAALPPVWLAMVGVAWCSVAIGLLLSAVDPSGGRFSVMLAVAVVLPQLLLSGGLGPDYYGRMGSGLQGVANLLPARWGLEMVCSALFGSFSGAGACWIPAFVREVIGFDFGRSVYYSGTSILLILAIFWLFLCAAFLWYRDNRSC